MGGRAQDFNSFKGFRYGNGSGHPIFNGHLGKPIPISAAHSYMDMGQLNGDVKITTPADPEKLKLLKKDKDSETTRQDNRRLVN